MMTMINSLKNNNRRRKNHSAFNKDKSRRYSKERPYGFPEATAEALEKIKSNMIREQKADCIKTILIFICIVVLILIIII